MPTDLLVRDGVIGPFVVSVVDFYNQSVSSAVTLRSQVTIHPIGTETTLPQLTGI